MESLSQTLGSISHAVASAFTSHNNTPQELTRSDVNLLEEHERERRMAQSGQAQLDKTNAANVSSLIRTQSFPVFRGNISKGYKRHTTRFEEEERRRRLTNKSESALRRNNANKTSRMIQSMGWPFYQANHAGPEYIVMDPTKLLEEEEREWRSTDTYWAPTAKHNAATIANILRWGNFQKNPKTGYRHHTRYLEAKERNGRLNYDTQQRAIDNAYNESGLIREQGEPFYVQTPLPKRDFSLKHKIDDEERKHRIKAGGDIREQMAREFAADGGFEEEERIRRLQDIDSQKLAKENAKQVSLLVRESSSNKINGSGPVWFSVSRNSMRALEEIERTRRLRDTEGQELAKQHAKSLSDIVLHKWSLPQKSTNAIEEEERQNRILDRALQQTAVKNARKVSGMIARHNLLNAHSKSFALAMEESERSRRLQDNEQQNLARDNAKKVSSLVSSLSLAPGNHVQAPVSLTKAAPIAPTEISSLPLEQSLPTQTQFNVAPVSAPLSPVQISSYVPPTESLPTYNAPVSPAPIAVTIPPTPVTAAPIAASTPVVAAAPLSKSIPTTPIPSVSFAPISSSPISSAPVSSIPRSSGEYMRAESPLVAAAPSVTRSSAPVSTPVYSAPVSTPVYSAPISAPVSTPVYSAPVSAPTYSAPISAAPISTSPTIQPFVIQNTAAPVPVAPLATAERSFPVRQPSATTIPSTLSFATPTVPIDSIALAHPPLGDRQRKKLQKQVEKHNRKSEKDVRKAEQQMLKAEKMHQKGRDDRAMKLEHKAENLMKLAEHERRWASGIQGELSPNAPAPASM